MARIDPHIAAHLEWLGFVRPVGLVVSAPALVKAGAILHHSDRQGQERLQTCIEEHSFPGEDEPAPYLPDFRHFAEIFLGWRFSPTGYAGTEEQPIPEELEHHLPEYGETLRPDFAVRERNPKDGALPWQLLVTCLPPGQDFDQIAKGRGQLEASPHSRMERLLRHTNLPAGLLFNGRALRLISAPRGESSGWLDFRVADMVQTAGRPICTALRMLLNEQRLLAMAPGKRLAALLAESRKFQNEVSEELAEQVLHALYELLRGLQSAHASSDRKLLSTVLAEDPNQVYRALLTVILRLVFLLYSEERDLLPSDETFLRHYSLAALFERLREDASLYPDTMDQRFGAWAQLLVLFRMVHDGAHTGALQLPARHGVLFDPDRFPFLEGRPTGSHRQTTERIDPPLIPDGTIYRALDKLLVLDGERISYRALDVEQIGSVYETMMGFRLETATGTSIAIKAKKTHGAPTTIDLQALLAEPPKNRSKWIQTQTGREPSATIKKTLQAATTLEDLHASLLPIIDRAATPDLVPAGSLILQPSEERRKSGSHYTPRSLTEPIVAKTLEPILARLRGPNNEPPLPDQLLDLKVCDPAMGSGAFLVEICRQLGDALVESWTAHDCLPPIPQDEDERILARRLIAQRCLYGVDRNPMAVDLAKVSLWLITLAKDHALTFVDHALRHGDSLVGLSRAQLEAFTWDLSTKSSTALGTLQNTLETKAIRQRLAKAQSLRHEIRHAKEDTDDASLRRLWDDTRTELSHIRLIGGLILSAFFEGNTTRDRETKLHEYAILLQRADPTELATEHERLISWRHEETPLAPFHWEIEFPEVFDRDNPGFDAMVGNPPFAGKNSIASSNLDHYPDWLKQVHAESHGNADLVAHFFRRSFDFCRSQGSYGLIATNTIGQGDTRSTGLRWICQHGGEIYTARKRVKWPGRAAVVVSVLHIFKGNHPGPKLLDDRPVEQITAFLFHRGGHGNPTALHANAGKSFVGSYVLGMGFTFDDRDKKGIASPIAEMRRLIAQNPHNQAVIFPYIGGKEVNDSPSHAHHRYVINFGERSEAECRKRWPDLMAIVEAKVKPERMHNNRETYKRYWWQYGEKRVEMWQAIASLNRVLTIPRVGQHGSLAFLPSNIVVSEQLIVFPLPTNAAFCALQSRPHELWARFFGSSLEDRLRYTPSDCFETFPFPENWEQHPALEAAGQAYYEFRAALMIRNDQGMTKTYNRFHDPEERDPDIQKLRDLHAAMDQAVLHAYGWTDIDTTCDFLLDYEVEEDEPGKKPKKKPFRYRWPNPIHDEVLARLLELNATRAHTQSLTGPSPKNPHHCKPPAPSPRDLFS